MSRFCEQAHAAVRRQPPQGAPAPAPAFTAAELAECARREVKQRRRVYQRLVGSGSMTAAQALREIAMMEAIAADYAARAEAERVRHVKRGTEYEVVGTAEGQVSTGFEPHRGSNPIREVEDGTLLTIYRSLATGKLHYRFPDEFRDGRFVTLDPSGEARLL